MTERFYFDLVNGSRSIPDEEGVEAADLDEAVSQAGEVLAGLQERGELSDEAEAWALVIRDESGAVRHRFGLL